jgi:exopolysaccharide biosynthesis polyprenyl glycosylphosphotransferase
MAATLLFLEGGSIFGVVCMTLSVWMRPLLANWIYLTTMLGQALTFSLCCLAAFTYNGLYDLRAVPSLGDLSSRLIRSIPLVLVLLALAYAVVPQSRIPMVPLISSLAVMTCLFFLLRAFYYGLIQRRPFLQRVLIVGVGPLAQKLVREIERQSPCRYAVVGIVDNAAFSGKLPFHKPVRRVLERLGYPYMGPLSHLRKIVEEVRPERIIVALPEGLERSIVRHALIESRCEGIIVEDGIEVYERTTGKVAIEWLTPQSLIFSKEFRRCALDLALARTLSLAVAAVGFVVSSPLFAILALAIKLDSPGPVLFVQDRIGLRGKRFKLLKFRTMRTDGEKISEWARDNADRITRVGKWLRKFRLDELPQFVNILKGDMNLVGPRPHPASNFELFVLVSRNAPECGLPIPYYSLRSMVRPGITGWAQVRYRYANGLEEEMEKMRYDLYYVKYMSFWFDLLILFETVKVILFGQESRDSYPDEVPAGRPREGLERAA